jgi:ATP-dependent Clp protease protease subunit
MWNLSTLENTPSRLSMSVNMYRGGGGGGYGRPRTAPPDLPSLLLDARICYLGMPVIIYRVYSYFFFYLVYLPYSLTC